MVDIHLPFSEDGFYRFGDLPWLIATSLVPDDESAKDWIRCVTTWKEDGSPEGEFLRRIAPDGVRTEKLDACNSWPATAVDLSREPEDRSKSNLFHWLWHEQRRSPEWRNFLQDGSLVIHTDAEPLGSIRQQTLGLHQLNYEKALGEAVENRDVAVCNVSGLRLSFIPLGQALKDAVVHIDELNRWGGTLQGGQKFLMLSAPEEPKPVALTDIEFAIPLIPTEVPEAILKLPPDSMISYSTGRLVGFTGGRTSVAGVIELVSERLQLRSKGRYSLMDAARILELEAGEDGRQILDALTKDAVAGKLDTHQAGKNATFDASMGTQASARSLETTAETLNSWLGVHHPLVTYRFKAPAARPPTSLDSPETIGETSTAMEAEQRKSLEAGRKAEQLLDGRYFLDEAAREVAAELGHGDSFAEQLCTDMKRCGSLPDDHPNKLVVRDFHTRIPVPSSEPAKLFHMVYRSDVNGWLDATGAGYQWRTGSQPPAEVKPVPAASTTAEPMGDAPSESPAPKTYRKAALIAALKHEWPTIEKDLNEATRNGLKDAAHTGKHAMWTASKAREWAISRGKITQTAPIQSSPWLGPTRRHRMEG